VSRAPKGVPPRPDIAPPIDWREARRLYVDLGLGPCEIARRMGYSYCAVHKALRKHAPRRPPMRQSGKQAAKIYQCWKNLRQRVAAGTISPDWERFHEFYRWARTRYAPGLCLSRIDPARRWAPSNCRFMTRQEDIEHSLACGSRPAARVTVFGETKTVREWARDRRCIVTAGSLRYRLQAGMIPAEALTTPPMRTHGSVRRRHPALMPSQVHGPRKTDWPAIEREWIRERTSFDELAQRLRVSRATVVTHLGPVRARIRAEEEIAPPEQRGLLHRRWNEMLGKCRDPAHVQYHRHGARGIDVCRSWEDLDAFSRWAVGTGFRKGLWLSRKDKRRGFSPANCVWLDVKEARRQIRLDSKPMRIRWPITAFGETRSPLAWAHDRRCAVSYTTLLLRLRTGWPAERAILEPPGGRGGQPKFLVRAFGRTLGLDEWARDPRCTVRGVTVRDRLLRGIPAEEAIATPGYRLGPRRR
jgi:hypothetical protein